MANNRENYYIKLVLEAIDRSSPAFAAVEKRLNDLNKEFKKTTGYTEDQRRGQERLNDELETSEKRYQNLDRAASSRTKTTKEQIKSDQSLAKSRVELANAETFLAETLNDVNATEDEIQSARDSRRTAERKLIDDAIDKRREEIESELDYANKIEKVNDRIAKTNREISKAEADRSNMRLRKAREQEAVTKAEQKLRDLEAIVDKSNQTVTLDNNAFGKKYKSEAIVRGLITKQERAIKELKSEGTERDFKGLDYLEGSIRATTTRITGLNDQVKSLRKELSSLSGESQAKADSLLAGRGIDKDIEGAVQLLSAEQELSAFRNRDFANRREQINQEIDDIERAAEAEAKAVEEKAASRKKIDAEKRREGLAKRDEIRAEEKARDQERRDREDILKQVILLTKESQKNGAYSSAANKQIRQELNYLKRAYVDLGGSGRDFQNVINENAKTQSAADNDAIQSLYERGKAYDQLVTKLEKYKNQVREARISGDKPGEQIANADLIATREKLEAEKAIIEKSLSEISIKTNFDIDEVSEAKLEAVRAAAGRDINIDVNFDTDQKSLTLFAGLAGAFNAFSEGTDRASRGIAAFDNIIRGLLVLGIALFFEQIIISAIGAVAALTALAASAIAAGSALAGALAAGALQAAPAIGVLAAFANRVTNVFQAVKQANLLQQQESYKGGQAATKQANALDGVVSASERVKEAQDAVTEARKKARQTLEDLILQERRQALGLQSTQEKLNSATSSFGYEQAQLDVAEAQKTLGRTRSDLSSRRRSGIEGSPEVTTAVKNLEQAQRALVQARQSATQAGAAVDATTGKLDFLLSNLSTAERRLYKGLVELQNRWRKFAQQVSEPLTNSFVFAVDRINDILKSPRLINVGKSLGEALGQSFRRVFNFLLSGETISRLLAFADDFKRNLAPLTNIAINLSKIFLDIGEAANPVLATIIDYFDQLIAKFADFIGSTSGKNQLVEFFDAGSKSLIKFFDLVGAVTRVILALIGKPGSGMGLDAGNVVLDQLISGLNKLADDIANPSTKVSRFFKRFFDFAKEVLPLFKPLVVAIGEALDRVFTKDGVESLRGFVDFISKFVIPAIADFALGVAKVTKIVVDLTDQFPLLGKALQAFIAVALAGSVLGRVNSLLAPFQSLAAYAFIGKGKQSIFKILAADADGAFPSIKKVLDAWNASDALFKPSRFGIKGKDAAKGLPGAASGLTKEALPGTVTVAETAAGGGGLAGLGATLSNPVTITIAAVAALTAAFIALLAIAGRLDDVIKAAGEAFKFVSDQADNAYQRIKDAFEKDKNARDALKVWVSLLKKVGNVLADFQIKQFKGVAVGIAAIIQSTASVIIFAIKAISGVIGTVRNLFRAVKLIKDGIHDIFLGIFDLFTGKGSDRLKNGASELSRGIAKAFLSPLALLRITVGRMFNGMFAGLLKNVETAVNLIRKNVKTLADVYNATVGKATGKIDTSALERNIDMTPETRRKKATPEEQEFSSGQRPAGRGSRRVDSSGRRVTPQRQKQAAERKKLNLEDAEKFLNAFDPETVKLSDEITKKIAHYWRTLRRQVKDSVSYVRDKLSDIRKDGGKDIDKFVNAAQSDLGRLRRSFRSNFLGIAAIVRNQMVNVSNIVVNQMQNAAMAIYKGAKYIKNALNDALKSVGSDSTVKLTLEAPKIRDERKAIGGFVGRAGGGWIGNRGERGRDAVPTLLGRGEAVLNWGQQKIVEPALRQTYGFGLDDMFDRTHSYHAGGPGTTPGFARGRSGNLFRRGRASWFGGPNDGMNTGTAIGVPDTTPGIALLNQPTLRKWFDVVSPRGRRARLKQIDIGPAAWTGKILDITSAALKYFGYNEKNFPTGVGTWSVYGPYGRRGSAANTASGAAEEIAMPVIKGGTKVMRDMVTKGMEKVRKAANRKIERETPAEVAGAAGNLTIGRGAKGSIRQGIALARRMGLRLSSFNEGYPGDGVHTPSSFHYKGRAIDVSGSASQMAAFFRAALKRFGKNIVELFYTPLGSIKYGQNIAPVPDHYDHVHLALARGGRAMTSKRSMRWPGSSGYGTPSAALQKQWEHYHFDRYADWLRAHGHSRKMANGKELFTDADGNEYFPAIRGSKTFNTSHLSPRDVRSGNWDWFNKGGRIKHFARGGFVDGPEGEAVPIMAHAGEWVLNKKQQKMIAAAAGLSPNALKGKLGFGGGPFSFKDGGEVKPTEAFKFPFSEKMGLTNFPDNAKFFNTQLKKFGDAIDKLLSNILSTADLEKTRERLENKIKDLKKNGTTDKEKSKIKDLETQLKNVDRGSSVQKLLDSVRALTGTDGDGGAIGAYYQKIKRTFDETILDANRGAAGIVKIGNTYLLRKQKIDPVKVAQAQVDAQDKLFKDLNKTIGEYAKAVDSLKEASDKIGASRKTKGPNKGDLIVRDLGTLVRDQRKDESELEKLEEKKEPSSKQKERIKELKKRTQQRKKDIDAKNKVELDIKNLEDKKRAAEQEAIDAENARVDGLLQVIAEREKQATAAGDLLTKQGSFNKSIGEVVSSFGSSFLGQTGQQLIDSAVGNADTVGTNETGARSRLEGLKQVQDEAFKIFLADGGNNPKLKEEVDRLTAQVLEGEIALQQAIADRGANIISSIQKGLEDATKQIDFEGAVNNAKKSLFELLGDTDGAKNAATESINFARRRQDAIDAALAEATRQRDANPNDPRFQQLVNDLTQQAAESRLAVAQAQAELINQQIAAIEKAFQNSEAYRGIDERRAAIQERLGDTTGAFNSRSAILAGRGSALQTQADNLRALLSDPNINPEQRRDLELKLAELAVALEENTQETKDLKIAYLENQAEQEFQRAETARGLRERAANLLERSGFAGAAFNQRQAVLQSRIGSQQAQADALRALLNDPVIAGNAAKIEELTNKINDLDMSVQENTREMMDLTLQYQKAQLDLINERTTTTTGLLGNAQSIFENIARLSGAPDTQDRVRIAQRTGEALNNEAQLLAQQVRDVLAQGTLTGEGGNTDAINLLQQLLQAFSTGDPGSFAGTLESLASQIQAAAFADGFDPEQKNLFLGLINSLTNNTIQVTDNTAQLRELNGIANQPQAFSSTSWTRFRAAIFNGLGDVLPQFDIPQMATGGYITKGGMFELHPGEFVVKSDGSNVDQGDINITVNEANKPLDVTALASRIAFEKRTRK